MELSPKAAPYLQDYEHRMWELPATIDWERYDHLKSYNDPGWRCRSNRLSLATRMMQAGMIDYVGVVHETVGLLCVAKDVSDDGLTVFKSRLVWDARRVHLRFRRLPWAPLGSSATHLKTGSDIMLGANRCSKILFYICMLSSPSANSSSSSSVPIWGSSRPHRTHPKRGGCASRKAWRPARSGTQDFKRV